MKKLKKKSKKDETKETQEEKMRRTFYDIFTYKHAYTYKHALALHTQLCFTQSLCSYTRALLRLFRNYLIWPFHGAFSLRLRPKERKERERDSEV